VQGFAHQIGYAQSLLPEPPRFVDVEHDTAAARTDWFAAIVGPADWLELGVRRRDPGSLGCYAGYNVGSAL
jgi:hypothetical protein